jgi:hypothetical protein
LDEKPPQQEKPKTGCWLPLIIIIACIAFIKVEPELGATIFGTAGIVWILSVYGIGFWTGIKGENISDTGKNFLGFIKWVTIIIVVALIIGFLTRGCSSVNTSSYLPDQESYPSRR